MANRSAYVIFCDDLRIENSNKRIFVGVYGTEMYVDSIPMVSPRFCVVSTLICELTDLPTTFAVRLTLAGEEIQTYSVPTEELAKWRLKVERELEPEIEEFKDEEPPKTRLSVEMTLSPFVIATEGRLSAYIETEKGTVRAGSLRIIKSGSSTAK